MNDTSVKKEPRNYGKRIQVDEFGDLYTIKEWEESVNIGLFTNYDGSGYWVKNEYASDSEVFATPKLDATHVIWYNK